MESLDELVDRVEEISRGDYRFAVGILVRCLKEIEESLPKEGLEALDISKAYWLNGEGTDGELTRSRVACWKYLDNHGSSTDLSRKEFRAMRALICTLHPEPPSEDLSELVEFFLQMCSDDGAVPRFVRDTIAVAQ